MPPERSPHDVMNDWIRGRRPVEPEPTREREQTPEQVREARIEQLAHVYSVSDLEAAWKLIGADRVDAASDSELRIFLEQAIRQHPGLGTIPVLSADGGAGRREQERPPTTFNDIIRGSLSYERERRARSIDAAAAERRARRDA